MFHRIFKLVASGASSQSGVLSGQDCNGLIITTTVRPSTADYITAVLKSDFHAPIVLINRVNLRLLSEVADILGGFSGGLQADQQAEAGGTTFAFYSFAIPLGCLKNVSNHSQIEITLEVSQAQTISVASYFNDDGADRIKKYLVSSVLNDTYRNIDKVFIYTTNTFDNDFSTQDVSVFTRSNDQASNCTLMEIVGGTYALGQLESAPGVTTTALIFDSMDTVNSSVEVNISGSDAPSCSLLGISDDVDLGRVSRSQKHRVGRAIQRMETLPVEKRKAFERSGEIPKLDDLREAHKVMNVPNQEK